MRACVVGASGRLGSVIAKTFTDRGDDVCTDEFDINYLVFAHRYRGKPDYEEEMAVNVGLVIDMIDAAVFAPGDKGIVLISSVNADEPTLNQSLSYNVSKAALNQLARFYSKVRNIRINTVSPNTFTGPQPLVSAQEVANVVAFLCTPQASGINGQDIKVTRAFYEHTQI